MRVLSLPLLLLFLATPAHASDGVLEINQTCAIETGCFPGDAAGFPVEIAASGSYRLTSNLSVPDATDGIFTSGGARSIFLDLNGFEIACATPPCTNNAGSGVVAGPDTTVPQRQLLVRNGTIAQFGRAGIVAGGFGLQTVSLEVAHVSVLDVGQLGITADAHCRLVHNRIISPGVFGIAVTSGGDCLIAGNVVVGGTIGIDVRGGSSVIRENTVENNSGDGIECASDCVVTGNRSSDNGGDGIATGERSTVIGNVANANGGAGVRAGNDSIVRSTTAAGNAGDGIAVGDRSLISDCAALGNGGNGITAGAAASVQRSISRGNTGGEGLNLDATATYREITTGTLTGGIDMGANSCNGMPTCP